MLSSVPTFVVLLKNRAGSMVLCQILEKYLNASSFEGTSNQYNFQKIHLIIKTMKHNRKTFSRLCCRELFCNCRRVISDCLLC